MADDKAQTGGGEERREGLGSSLLNEKEALTGVSNGDTPEIVINNPAPVAAAPKPKGTADGVTPVGEAVPVAAAVATEEAPDPKAAKPGEPVVQAPQQTAPKKDEYSRDDAQAPSASQAAAAAAAEEETINDTRKMRQLLNDKWGLQWPDPILHNILQKGSVTKSMTGGLVFELESGSTIKWHENFLQQGEFVGKTGLFAKVTEEEAEATVAIAKNRGWSKINVYGNRDQKELFWLEAKKQGLEVANFQPMADSPIMQKLAEFQQGQADKTVAGVQPADNAPLAVTGEVKPGEDEKGGRRRAATAEEPKPVAAAAEATATDKATPPAASVVVVNPTSAAPVAAEAAATTTTQTVKEFFDEKIGLATSPRMKESLGKICERVTADGADPAVAKQVCEALGAGKATLSTHNAAVAIVNDKLPGAAPLEDLGQKPPQAPQRGPRR